MSEPGAGESARRAVSIDVDDDGLLWIVGQAVTPNSILSPPASGRPQGTERWGAPWTRLAWTSLTSRRPTLTGAHDPKGFSFHWMQLQFLFNLPYPYEFPAVDGLNENERTALARYARNCAELAESTLLSYDGSLTTRIDGKDSEVRVELDTVPRETAEPSRRRIPHRRVAFLGE